ncbi:uncharacterized protein EV422DRAFT_566183 [Fimicolochytrium jonesii]|uniref:uncharacterized protein n=1 Tax=Fimicolochytrium jonesii TaxID=1396493 RepID=UPI0022FF06B2|nr:uncharacterized protein EV422DRAFT_566183 [Fimicolochytrium jonesii]KAI8822495.1 hypothetical protein EV422DRAFT_566183 [Fimicolochytrium jonesii]
MAEVGGDARSRILAEFTKAGRPLSAKEVHEVGGATEEQAALESLLAQGEIKQRIIPVGLQNLVVYWHKSLCPVVSPAASAKAALEAEVAVLRRKMEELEEDTRAAERSLGADVNIEQEINNHIKRLHAYNEVKDVGWVLSGT